MYGDHAALLALTPCQVLIGKKDTQIYVIELATGRVIDSVVASDEDPLASMPFTGHWPPGCVLISASTYTVKGLHPLSPENKYVMHCAICA